jgi:hypothetical protein
LCEKCDDIITCAGSGQYWHPDKIEPGAPYFGKSLPVRPLQISLVKFAFKACMVRGFFGKLSLSDIPIKNNQVASDQASAVAKVPSK